MKGGKHSIAKSTVPEWQIKSNNRDVSLIEDEEVFYTDMEISTCTVIPKGIFIMYKKCRFTESLADQYVLSDSTLHEKKKDFT
jgi:hypothetical protein